MKIEINSIKETNVNKLNELLSKCKCGVHITVNQHRDEYMPIEGYIDDDVMTQCCPPKISDEIMAKIIATDTIINIHFYPDTPIGFYDVYHYDMDMCLDRCLEILKEQS